MTTRFFLGIAAIVLFMDPAVRAETLNFSQLQTSFSKCQSAVSESDAIIGDYSCISLNSNEETVNYTAKLSRTCVGVEFKTQTKSLVLMVRNSGPSAYDLAADSEKEELVLRLDNSRHLVIQYQDRTLENSGLTYSYCTKAME